MNESTSKTPFKLETAKRFSEHKRSLSETPPARAVLSLTQRRLRALAVGRVHLHPHLVRGLSVRSDTCT